MSRSLQARDIPLTTTFTPTSCQSTLSDKAITEECTTVYGVFITCYAWRAWETVDSGQCYPSGWAPASYFSPGLCPSGYRMGFSSVVSLGTLTETHGTCCPTHGDDFTVATARPALFNASWPCVGPMPYTYSETITHASEVPMTRTTYGFTNAPGVYVRWAPTDFVAPQTATTTGSPLDAASTAISDTSKKTNHGSTRKRTVIGLAVPFGFFLISTCALVIIIFLKRRKSSSKNSPRLHGNQAVKAVAENEKISEMSTQPWNTTELPSSFEERHELQSPSHGVSS